MMLLHFHISENLWIEYILSQFCFTIDLLLDFVRLDVNPSFKIFM